VAKTVIGDVKVAVVVVVWPLRVTDLVTQALPFVVWF